MSWCSRVWWEGGLALSILGVDTCAVEVWLADSSSSPAPGVPAGGRTLSWRGMLNFTINNLLWISMRTKRCLHSAVCCEGVWRRMFSWLCSHVFLACYCDTQAITVSICLATVLLPKVCPLRLIDRAAQERTSCFVHLSYLFHFHWIQELLEDWVPMESWKNFQFSRTSFSGQIVGVVTFKKYDRLEKTMCTDLIGLRLNLSNHFQSLGNAATMAVLKFFQSVSFLRWARI